MKKPKVSLNGAAIKEFFINNGEKLILGVVVLLLLNFAYGAITAQPIDPGKADEIKQASAQALARINETAFDKFIEGKPEFNLPDFTVESRINNQPLAQPAKLYRDRPLAPEIFKQLIKRADPTILPPLEVTGSGQVVLVPFLRELEAVSAVAPGTALPPRMARKEEEKAAKKAGKGGKVGTPEGEMGGPLGPRGIPGMRPGRGEEDAPTTAAVTDRSVSGAPLAGTRATNADLKLKGMAIVTALVPFEEQYKEYKKRFEDALGKGSIPVTAGGDQYTPIFVYFYIERAEVKDHRDQKLDWKGIEIRAARQELALMVPTNPQSEPPIDPQYSFLGGSTTADPSLQGWPEFLEWPLPPVVLRNWGFEVTHPKVPFLKPVAMETMQQQQFFEPGKAPLGPDGLPLPNQAVPGGASRGFGGMHGGRGMGGMEGEFGGRGGMMRPPGQNFGADGMSTVPQVPYKLFRYVDLTCEPGKCYRYRVKLKLINPNAGLPPAFLADAASRDRPYVDSEWSAPSSVIEIPMNGQALAVASAGGTSATANEAEGQISIQQIVKWEKKDDRKRPTATAPTSDPLSGMGMQNTEPTEGWIEALKDGLKIPLGGLVYFPNQAVEKVLDMAVEIEKKKVEGLTLSCQPGREAMLLDVRSDDPLGVAKAKGVTEMLYFAPDGRLFATHSGVDRQKSEDYKDRTYVPANITGGGMGGPGSEFGPPGGGRFRGE